MKISCHDCKKAHKTVQIRQSDYMLCDNCEAARQRGEIKIGMSTTGQQSQNTPKMKQSTPKDIDSLCSKHDCTGNPDKDRCICSVCAKQYHIICAKLKKVPAKSTKWVCQECKDFHTTMKNLQATVVQLTDQILAMSTKQQEIVKNQDVLQIRANESLRN